MVYQTKILDVSIFAVCQYTKAKSFFSFSRKLSEVGKNPSQGNRSENGE